MWNLFNNLLPRYLAIEVGGSVPANPLANIQKLTAKVAADGQDKKINDETTLKDLQTQINTTISTKDFSNLSAEVRAEVKQAKQILADITANGGKVTPQQVATLKLLSEKILVSIQPPDTEVKWATLNVKIKDDDARYNDMKTNRSLYLDPDGGLAGKSGVGKTKFSDGTPVPTLQQAIYEDFAAIRGKCKSPQELQTVIQNGFGKKLPDEDAQALFDFIQKGSIGGSDKVTTEDVGKLQKILGSISPHFEQRLAKNGLYDSKYGYATTEEVRLLAAQIARTNDADVPKWVPKKDAVYIVDNSGSMTEKTKSMYNLIDKYQKQPEGTTRQNQVGTFREGEQYMNVGGMGGIGNKGAIDKALITAFSQLVGAPPKPPATTDAKAMAEYSQKKAVYDEKLADYAKLLNVSVPALKACMDQNGNLGADKFRSLMGDDFQDKQESGLKAALVAMLLNPSGTKDRDLYICADEPEHEPQYLELVKRVADMKGINITIVAMPTAPPVTEKNMKFIPLDSLTGDAVRKNLNQGEYKWTAGQKTVG